MKTICFSEARPLLAGAVEKIAPTAVLLARVTLHSAAPEHAPVHPVKVEPPLGFAVSVTDVPLAKLALHVSPQLMPAGALVTVPVPLPEFVTIS
jgi:hypothetical protein